MTDDTPRDPPRCYKCGHSSSYHGMTFCTHDFGSGESRTCDCSGFDATRPSGDEALRAALEAELASERGKPTLMRSSGYESGIEFALRALLATPASSPDVEGLCIRGHRCAACAAVLAAARENQP